MADRYPNRSFPPADYGHGDQLDSGDESDPLAELARLIGQTDPFAGPGSPNPAPPHVAPARAAYQAQYQAPAEEEDAPALGRPQWIQRANIQREAVQAAPARQTQRSREMPHEAEHDIPYEDEGEEHPSAVHPLHSYAAQQPTYQRPAIYPQPPAYQEAAAHQQDYREPPCDEAEQGADPSRYDDALYGQLESGEQDFQRERAYPDDPYAHQDRYEDEQEESPKRRGGLLAVAAVLALAVVGTGAAFAYRTYVGSARTGEPPIIKADNTPTKIIPAQADVSGKNTDRLPVGEGTEKMVSREETPVDVNAQTAGPRVVFPPLNQNANPPSAASVATTTMSPPANAAAGAAPLNGTTPNGEPHKIRTLSVHGDQPDTAAAPTTAAVPATAKPTAATRQAPANPHNQAQASNGPLSLSPDSAQASMPPAPAEPRTRVASTTPTQIAPSSEAAPAAEGRFLVQISSQTSESEAQASFRGLQKKFPEQLGSQTAVIKRADLGEKGVRYRAMVGPFASHEEAARFCVNYKSAGGQCFVP